MANSNDSFMEKLGRIDRRWIFLVIALAVALPMFLGFDFKAVPSPMVENLYKKIEALPAGSRVLISFDYGPSTVPENQPMADAIVWHLLKKKCKVYFIATWPTGERQSQLTVETTIKKGMPTAVNGVDYVDLGYKAGGSGLINLLFSNFKRMYTNDRNRNNVENIPMMNEIESLKNFNMILSISSGAPGLKEWIQFAGDRGKIPVAGGVTAVQAMELYPYYPRQMFGLMAGLQGGAEYESIVISNYPEFEPLRAALKKMAPQTIAHLAIITLIIIGNIAYFSTRKHRR